MSLTDNWGAFTIMGSFDIHAGRRSLKYSKVNWLIKSLFKTNKSDLPHGSHLFLRDKGQ